MALFLLAIDFAFFMYVESRTASTEQALDVLPDDFIPVKEGNPDLDSLQVLQSFPVTDVVEKTISGLQKSFQGLEDISSLKKEQPSTTPLKGSAKPHDVIVLSFHDLSPERISPSIITPVESFEKMLKSFGAKKYETFFASDVSGIMEGRMKVKSGYKPLVITFDDGYRNNYSLLLPLLKKFKVRATIFLITAKIHDSRIDSSDNALVWSELREMVASGFVELGSHTHSNHKNLVKFLHEERTIPEKRRRLYGIYKDLCQSRELLEERLGISVVSLAWPHGKEDKHLIYAAKKAGFKLVFNTSFGINCYDNKSFYRLKRISASSPWLTSEDLLQRMSQAALGKKYCIARGL
jgi:peptidoglycan/xylan/chitin deacetylase (PgdA/CDA1 family)